MATGMERPTSKGALWYSRRVRAVVYQILVVTGVIGIGVYLVGNTLDNLSARGIATGFDFMGREAGFDIGESLIPYGPADNYGRAILVGLLNTTLISVASIAVATLIGLAAGIARLSGNWLLARIAGAYVEVVRNIPLLLQLFVWYGILTALPGPRQALSLFSALYLSNRGLKFPVPLWADGMGWVLGVLAVAIALAWWLGRWAVRRREQSGHGFPAFWAGGLLITALPSMAFMLLGLRLEFSVPELRGFNFQGGGQLSPEFAAVLAGLAFYTGGFIAEIVRSGVLSVPSGQTEAALSLGLSRGKVLRLVVLPQALRVMIPPLTNQYLSLIKNSSLAVAIGYPDLLSVANTTINQTGHAIEGVGVVMAVFLAISLVLSLLMNWYNARHAEVRR